MAARKTKKRGRGQPPFEPTEQDRQIVESLTIAGVEQTEIARCLSKRISLVTLRKAFAQELATGLLLFKARLIGSMRATAIGRPARPAQVVNGVRYAAQPAIVPNPIMQIWCSKNLLGWKDKTEHVGGDEPIRVVISKTDADL